LRYAAMRPMNAIRHASTTFSTAAHQM